MIHTVRTRRAWRASLTGDDGMSTAEYAVGTVATCGFAGILIQLLSSDWVQELLKNVIGRAFSFLF
jgi:hypothetical protein